MDIPVNTVAQMRALVRNHRVAQGLSQANLATVAGVSRKWLSEFERGKASAELGLVLGVVDALGIQLSASHLDAEHRPTLFDLDDLAAIETDGSGIPGEASSRTKRPGIG